VQIHSVTSCLTNGCVSFIADGSKRFVFEPPGGCAETFKKSTAGLLIWEEDFEREGRV